MGEGGEGGGHQTGMTPAGEGCDSGGPELRGSKAASPAAPVGAYCVPISSCAFADQVMISASTQIAFITSAKIHLWHL